MFQIKAEIRVGFVLFLLSWQSALASVIIPQTTLPASTTVCAPNTIPDTFVPSDFANCAAKVKAARGRRNPDQDKRTEEVITSHGYPLQVYNVTTADGYILTVQRINGSSKSPPAAGKPAVYLNHGMFGSSNGWLLLDGDRALGFKLADAGYDVWLGNCRGSSYSLGHETMNSDVDIKYWDFSWHEMGIYDVPAVSSKILEVTGNEQIMYVGYSMGTTQYFVSLSSNSDMNNKIQAAVMLAPVVYNGHSNNFVRVLAPGGSTPAQNVIGPYTYGKVDEFQKFEVATNTSLGDYCTSTAARCGLCDNMLYFMCGYDPSQTNYTNLPNILSKFPDTASLKTFVHYGQNMNTCSFRQYDYGILGNNQTYGTPVPPIYNITEITAPTYLIYAERDSFAPPIDVEITRSHMRPDAVKGVFRVNWDYFNHLDFQFAKDADTLVFNKVLEIFNSVRGGTTAN